MKIQDYRNKRVIINYFINYYLILYLLELYTQIWIID